MLWETVCNPYSLFVYEAEDDIIFRLSVLSPKTAPLIDACLSAGSFNVTGIPSGIQVLKAIAYPEITLADMLNVPSAHLFALKLVTVTTYKQDREYSNWFSLYPLLNSVALKLNAFEGCAFSDDFLKLLRFGG
ncbi:MAG: hypothetical protein LBS84_04030 [Clostridiales bacterium]|jgi:hypothetical protein|nr:hypothetical protein [Clostridiales bacterium]